MIITASFTCFIVQSFVPLSAKVAFGQWIACRQLRASDTVEEEMLPSCADSDRSCAKEIFDLPKSEFQGGPPIRKRTYFFLRGST